MFWHENRNFDRNHQNEMATCNLNLQHYFPVFPCRTGPHTGHYWHHLSITLPQSKFVIYLLSCKKLYIITLKESGSILFHLLLHVLILNFQHFSYNLTLFILVDYPTHTYTISMELSILYFKGLLSKFL